jgi:transposase
MWCVAKLDEEYIARMEEVLALYEKPLCDEEPVVCIDEKPVVLHRDLRPPVPMQPGQAARRDYEYKRCGTANVFCGIEPKAGRHYSKVTPTRCSAEFADYLVEIASRYPRARTIHLVMDNLSTHRRKALVDSFGEKVGGWLWNRFTPHYTPKHGSWLNQAEMEVGLFSRQCLGKRRIGDIAALRRQTQAWSRRMNRNRLTIAWKFTRRHARRKLHYKITQSRY